MNTGRTRRNVVKLGAILVSVAAGQVAAAQPGNGNQNGNGDGGNGHHWGWGDSDPHCLLRGTTIRTCDGGRKIQDLKIGDLLPTLFGGVRPIQWIARFPYKKSDPAKPWVSSVLPIRIARSALAPNVPENDLFVTSEHALLLDGFLIPVGNLINGRTIQRYAAPEYDELEYFHVKLNGHDVIYAEGAPVETMLKVDESASNFAEYYRLYGVRDAEETRCAPYATYGGLRGEFKSRLRSAVSPWLDRREPIDVVRDRLDERAAAFSRDLDLVR